MKRLVAALRRKRAPRVETFDEIAARLWDVEMIGSALVAFSPEGEA